MLLSAQRVTFGQKPHYAYRRRCSGSITSSTPQPMRFASLMKITQKLSEAYTNIANTSLAREFFIKDIRSFFRTCAQLALHGAKCERDQFEAMMENLPLPVKADSIVRRIKGQYIALKTGQDI